MFSKSRRKRKKQLRIVGAVAGVAVLAGASATLAMTMTPADPPPVSAKVAQVYAEQQARATAGPTKTAAPKVRVAPGTKVAFFGDSWTYGQSAEPITEGYAYGTARILNLDAEVLGDPGTGYLATGVKSTGNFLDRMKQLPVSDASVLILQGSINDQKMFMSQGDIAAAVQGTFAEARKKFPKAKIIVLGPAPNSVPVPDDMLKLDEVMDYWATEAGLHYISPVQENWITSKNVATVIDRQTRHPGIDGHQILAEKLVAAIR